MEMAGREYPPAGRELDRIVAERVMSGRVEVRQPGGRNARVLARIRFRDGTVADGAATEWCVDMDPSNHVWMHVPHYSTDIAAAFQVVATIQEQTPWAVRIFMHRPTRGGVEVLKAGADDWETIAYSTGELPEAICLAALRVVDAARAHYDAAPHAEPCHLLTILHDYDAQHTPKTPNSAGASSDAPGASA